MSISRRNLLRRIGAAAAATAATSLSAGSSGSAAMLDLSLSTESDASTRLAGPIRLHRNESPYGASAKVLAVMRESALIAANRYPEAARQALQDRIAAFHRVHPEQIVLGCGSSDILRMAIDAFVPRGKTLMAARPTFDLIDYCAAQAERKVAGVPLTANYAHDLDAMLAEIDAAGLVYICNPNNPTGTLTPRNDLEAFIARLPKDVKVLVDEAYHHYAGQSSHYASFIDRPVDDPRLIVVRTFSKIYGLAGLRIGYAVAAAPTAKLLAAHALSNPVNVVAANAAVAALDDNEHVRQSVRHVTDDRQEFLNQANARMVRSIDSRTNFVMLETGRPALEVIEHFASHDVLVAGPVNGFGKHIRVSLGTTRNMTEFWRVWDLMPGHTMAM